MSVFPARIRQRKRCGTTMGIVRIRPIRPVTLNNWSTEPRAEIPHYTGVRYMASFSRRSQIFPPNVHLAPIQWGCPHWNITSCLGEKTRRAIMRRRLRDGMFNCCD